MTDESQASHDPEQPVSTTPLYREGARDVSEEEFARFEAEIAKARNQEEFRRIGDEIVAATGYGSTHVLNAAAFHHALALSGLERAAALAGMLEAGSQKHMGPGEPQDENYHGYREALYSDEP